MLWSVEFYITVLCKHCCPQRYPRATVHLFTLDVTTMTEGEEQQCLLKIPPKGTHLDTIHLFIICNCSDREQEQCFWNKFSWKMQRLMYSHYKVRLQWQKAGTVFVKNILLRDVNGCPSAPSPAAPTGSVAWDLLKWKMCAANICHRAAVLTLLSHESEPQ